MATIYWKSTKDTISTPIATYKAPPTIGPNSTFVTTTGGRNPSTQYTKDICHSETKSCNVMITHLVPKYENCCTKNKDKISRSVIVPSNSERYAKTANSMSELLRKRCVTYNQRLSGTPLTTNYHAETSTPTDTYSRNIGSCSISGGCKTTYKPNNKRFAQRGAVDSSSRLSRLKNDTITKNFKSLADTYGINTANRLHSIPSYNLKSKMNVCNSSLYRRNGSKLVCL